MQNKVKLQNLPIMAITLVMVIILIKINVVFSPPEGLLNWYNSDDAFYYFKVAQNITEGKGISFDGINHTNGFHPLWLVICTPVFALARLDLFLPLRLIAVISIVLNAGTSLLIYLLVKRVIEKEVGFFIALLWAFSPDIHKVTTEQGMESGLVAFSILLLIFVISKTEHKEQLNKKEVNLIGLLATLVLFSRLDNVFLVIILGFWLIFKKSPNLRYLFFFDILISFTSVLISFYSRVGFRLNFIHFTKAAVIMVVMVSIIRPIIYYFSGLYHITKQENKLRNYLKMLFGVSITTAVIGIFMNGFLFLGVITTFPRSTLIIDWGISLVAIFITRALYIQLTKTGKDPIAKPIKELKENWRSWLHVGFNYFSFPIIALAVFLFFNTVVFGHPMPISGEIKQWWGTMQTIYGIPVGSFEEVFGLPNGLNERPWMLMISLPYTYVFEILKSFGADANPDAIINISGILVLFSILILIWKVIRNRDSYRKSIKHFALLPLLTACYFQIYYYAITNYVHTRNWYWIGEMIGVILICSLLLGSFYRWLQKHNLKILLHITRIFLVTFIFLGFIRYLPLNRFSDAGENPTLADVEMIEQLTEENAVIGMTGGGITAYFINNRTIVNLDGLMNSIAYFESLKKCTLDEYLATVGMSYVFGNKYVLTESPPYKCIYQNRLDKIAQLNEGSLFRFTPQNAP